MNFDEILDKYRRISTSERDKGERFERLIKTYLETDPLYRDRFNKVWMWGEFPARSDLGRVDTGIDLVARTYDGDYWAIQCKCYLETTVIDKSEVDTFLSTSGRSFMVDGQKQNFSNRLWVSTSNKWSNHANEALKNQHPPIERLNLETLRNSAIDWDKLDRNITGLDAILKRDLLDHQRNAVDKTIAYLTQKDRGQLIMACGTGKTFTSLRIAEKQTSGSGVVLFLVPSIALLGQTLREWTAYSEENIKPIAICSDPKITKKRINFDATNDSTVDLAIPASTNITEIVERFTKMAENKRPGMTVVFSTYQSIEVISKVQKELNFEFDLIICDEAHRTTGIIVDQDDKSTFVRVHDNAYIASKKRIYMTATPRLYAESSKAKASENNVLLCSMDDESLYGEEIYRIGFAEAVDRGLLSDYKVLILTLNEDDVPKSIQTVMAGSDQEIDSNDISKLVGSINALSKQILGDKGVLKATDPGPMRRAVAFCQNISNSIAISESYNSISSEYKETLPTNKKEGVVNVKARHIDGTMSAPERDDKMGWLKSEIEDPLETRVLSNVRCLSEGVDVPTLDAVLFLSPRNSQVDVVQSVGRVMRKAPGKNYGYIIIPVIIPSDVEPEDALDDNEKYKVVWTVLNALRAHDDRFNAIINKIDLNKNKPDQIIVGAPDPNGDGDEIVEDKKKEEKQQLALKLESLQNALYARMVLKVGDRRYWEQWAFNVAEIAEKQISRIGKIVDEDDESHMAIREFVRGLRKNINPSITEQQAIEMLSQHIITKPIFEALFEGYSFVQNNAVSISMQKALDAIETKTIEAEDAELLEGFYKSVSKRAQGIDNSVGKQRIIAELYERFFKSAFPKMVEQLGIVYTPPEVVDFIIHSVDEVLKKEFNRNLTDENVNILDPFTGTGTFITRLLQSGVIKHNDLARKYKNEIFANEIVLLAYYIAAVNIENAFHDLLDKDMYESFEGIVLTDTFQLSEEEDNTKLFSDALAKNSERLQRQKNTPLRVIIGNPPYSVGQKSANDNAQNQKYSKLDSRISNTYAKLTNATNKNSLYDSYIKAFRWASDRLSDEGGVIGYVSNGSWIDGNAQDGMRKTLEKEFSSIYVFNLRGNQRTSGEQSRREGGKIFGSGSRTQIVITLLVKNPKNNSEKAKIYYHDIGDYLSREQKLKMISEFGSVSGEMSWTLLNPNQEGDWINLRNDLMKNFTEIGSRVVKKVYFNSFSGGLQTNRDPWTYNYSKEKLNENMIKMISNYNDQVDILKSYMHEHNVLSENAVDKVATSDSKTISWTRGLKQSLAKLQKGDLKQGIIRDSYYRPFSKQNLYLNKQFNEYINKMSQYFPEENTENLAICISSRGTSSEFASLIVDKVPNVEFVSRCQVFPLYYWEKVNTKAPSLFDKQDLNKYERRDGISDFMWHKIQKQYQDKDITKEDIFYYVYGLFHSSEYRNLFANDLKKMLPHIPVVSNSSEFWEFSKAGRQLALLHINYENVPPYEKVIVTGTQFKNYRVDKMRFASKNDKSKIVFNDQIVIENIPDIAYEYMIGSKSAIDWILDRYQIKLDKDSGIINDPNDYTDETGNQSYILDLLLSVINLSVQTMSIVRDLPKINFEELD